MKHMILDIILNYHTVWGECLIFCCNGGRHRMSYCGNGVWKLRLMSGIPAAGAGYSYEVDTGGKISRKERNPHIFPEVDKNCGYVRLYDRWEDVSANQPFMSSLFTGSVFARPSWKPGMKKRKPVAKCGTALITVSAPDILPGEVLGIAGSSEALGRWERPVALDDSGFPVWAVSVIPERGVEYKYVIMDSATGRILTWEEGDNRRIADDVPEDSAMLVSDREPCFVRDRWRGAGTAVPVFALRSENSFGTGEFNDLKLLVDWAAATGQRILQLLPVNDTTMTGTWEDSYPYNANSTFALHPQYINLPSAGLVPDDEYMALKDSLEALPQIDYETVNAAKIRLLRKLYSSKGKRTAVTVGYRKFIEKNESWLMPYAVFCCLRDDFGTADFRKWKSYSVFSPGKMESYVRTNPEKVGFWCFVQYNLHLQLSEVCTYARKHGIVLKGDLPIGVSRTSADAWTHPGLFNMDSQAGAPPDAFSATGQNWGFPTYNWEKMAADGYSWWRARLGKMSEYFDAFRIDHILGFFRIWEIPAGASEGLLGHFSPALPYSGEELSGQGFDLSADGCAMTVLTPGNDDWLFLEDPSRKGWFHPRINARMTPAYARLTNEMQKKFDRLHDDFFYRRHNAFWKESALKKLPSLLSATGMLACGEDLGMIPASVPEVMDMMKILSLEIQRMPKKDGAEFADTSAYPYLSVCTTSTHDMNPIRAWWNEDRDVTRRFWNNVLGERGEAPEDCSPEICARILEMHLNSPSMFAIFPLQDWLSIDGNLRFPDPAKERINVPAVPRHYWRYRLHLTLEALLESTVFNAVVRKMITSGGRS